MPPHPTPSPSPPTSAHHPLMPPDVTHSAPIQSSLIPEPYISPFSFKLDTASSWLLCLFSTIPPLSPSSEKRGLCQFHPSLKYLPVVFFSLLVSINLSQRRYSRRTPTCPSVFSVCKTSKPLLFPQYSCFRSSDRLLSSLIMSVKISVQSKEKSTTESSKGGICRSLTGAIKFIGEIRRPIEGPQSQTAKSYCPHKKAAFSSTVFTEI